MLQLQAPRSQTRHEPLARGGGARRRDDAALAAATLSGDESAFVQLVARYHASMTRLALCHARDSKVAQQIVTETWRAALASMHQIEGGSFKVWLFRLLMTVAKMQGVDRQRTAGASTRASDDFHPDGHALAGHWRRPPVPWGTDAATRLRGPAAKSVIDDAIAALPVPQRVALTLRDVEGWPAVDVCALLEMSDWELRMQLQPARAALRGALDAYLSTDTDAPAAATAR